METGVQGGTIASLVMIRAGLAAVAGAYAIRFLLHIV